MLNNLVNRRDATAFARRLHRSPRWLLRHLSTGSNARARDAWAHTKGKPIHWFDVPAILERQNVLVSGSPDVGYVDYVCQVHLQGRKNLRALSLGCGTGEKEAAWARTGLFSSIVGFDFAQTRIDAARELARREQLDHVLRFDVADAYTVEVQPESLDLVLFDDALHHFTPVDKILQRTREWLRDDGLLFVREFVGPRAFQWTDRQLDAANALLALLPPRLRSDFATGHACQPVERPSRLRMRITDPSEAVESDAILPNVRELFEVVEERPLGGTIVHLAIGDNAGHFINGDAEAAGFLKLMFDVEDALIAAGELPSDHTLIVARRR